MEKRLEKLKVKIDSLISKEDFEKTHMYISHTYGLTRFCILLAMKRNMKVELATACGMLHDIYYMTGRSSNNHAL